MKSDVKQKKSIDEKKRAALLKLQKDEITAHLVYTRLARMSEGKNREALGSIARDEMRHYHVWKTHTGQDIGPNKKDLFRYNTMASLFGVTFTIKLQERGEVDAQTLYGGIIDEFPELKSVIKDEHRHEQLLIGMIHEEKLEYIGSMVLGLNDALVELTGALAGLTLAFGRTRLVGISGLITGIAAALSMMSSEYLSKKSDSGGKNPKKAAMYTGIAYIMTVILLVFPYFLFTNIFVALGVTLALGIGIIAFFTYFAAVVHDETFKGRFLEMAGISLGVALISFLIGLVISHVLHINI